MGRSLTTGPIVNGSVVNSRVNDMFAFIFLFWVVIRCCELQGYVLHKSFWECLLNLHL